MRRRTTYFWLGLTAILLSGVFGLLAVPLWQLRQHQAARERWQHQRPGHYGYRVVWSDLLRPDHQWRVEVRDGQIVRTLDLLTNQPVPQDGLRFAGKWVHIDQLFDRIAERTEPFSSVRDYIARVYPGPNRWIARSGTPLARWTTPCGTPFPAVQYDETWGYPASGRYRSNPCIATASFDTDVQVRIDQFQSLP